MSVPARPSAVLVIAAAEDVAVLKAQPGFDRDIMVYPDTEALRALEAIAQHRPSLLVLDRTFVESSRGAAIINRIKTDPTLSNTQIRVIAQANDYLRLVSRRSKAGLSAESAVPGDPLPDDYRGTRVAARIRIDPDVEIRLDGESTTLIDLSGTGAQVRAPVSLRPGQRVRIAITDAEMTVRLVAMVAWASFEPARGDARSGYRVGIAFMDADAEPLEAFCRRHSEP